MSFPRVARCFAFAAMVCMAAGAVHAASLMVYLSPPGAVASSIPGVTTETFDNPLLLTLSTDTYLSPIGTYSTAAGTIMPVIAADQYGGAGNSQYMYVGQRRTGDATEVTLTLNAPVNYFGFWWSAGDPLNRVSVYSGNHPVASFQTSDITSLLSTGVVTALDGTTTYQSSQYYGNPNAGPFLGMDNAEPFAYVNVVANGFTFDRLVLDNNGGSGFENDNHSVVAGNVEVPTSFVLVSEYAVPEPGYFVPLGFIAAGALIRKLRRG